jgi:hypothetical protein
MLFLHVLDKNCGALDKFLNLLGILPCNKIIFFPTSSLKMTFPSLNLEMKVGVCITCEESKSLPSLVGKVKKKFDPHLGMYILSLK